MGKYKRFQRDIDSNTIEEMESILIVCEGKKTEPFYFEAFEVFTAKIEVIGEGKNTMSLVKCAIEYKNRGEYDQVWCVFDKDSFTEQQFNNACQLAVDSGLKLAYSNESFELWYILHFNFLTSQLNRGQYIKNLRELFTEKFNKDYKKNDKDVYNNLKPLQKTAIRNAKNLVNQYDERDTPSKQFPVTYVYKLVEELNKYSRENRWRN